MLDRLDLSNTQREELEEATAVYAAQLDQEALSYLDSRGLADAVAPFRLGSVVDPLPGHQQYVGRLVLPYLTSAGVVSIRFRAVGDDKVKMLGMAGAQPRMFNVAALHTGLPYVAIAEGEFDAMALTLAGLPTVGIPGTSMWFDHFPRVFSDFDTVYVITDNDVKPPKVDPITKDTTPSPNPGQDLARKIAGSLRNAKVIVPPPNLDANDFILRDGAAAVLAHIGLDLGCEADAPDVYMTQDESEAPEYGAPPF